MTTSVDFQGDTYLDASFVVAAMIAGSHHAAASHEFAARLSESRSHVHFSTILPIEISQALFRMGANPIRLSPDVRSQFLLDRWEHDFLTRHRWMAYGIDKFNEFQRGFAHVYEYPLSLDTWRRSVSIMSHYQLRSIDAIHVATAQTIGVRDFVTCDAGFRRVDGLNVILIRDTQ